MIIDEVPRGQLSTIILMTLLEKDKYGYEIIDEVLKISNGKVSIKQPSLYSSLKRMEDQSLISSYWRDSEIGGRRHYYHLTDLGKKHLEKWKTDLPDFNAVKEQKPQDDVKILQQENIFNLNSTSTKTEEKIEEHKKDDTFVQFDLFSNSTIVTPPSNNNSFAQVEASNTVKISKPVTYNKIITTYEAQDCSKKQTFEYVKKTNKSFTDKLTNNDTIYEKKYVVNQNKEPENFDLPKIESEILIEQPKNSQIESSKQTETAQELPLAKSIVQIENTNNDEITDNFSKDTQPSQAIVKDDGVFITERLNIEDMPKPTKWDSRRFEQYISANNVSPDLKPSKKSTNYEDRVKELYEQSKSNPENQELELLDNKVKFSNYKLLQQFYSEQNIKFKPFEKSLKKTDKDYNMLRVTKLNMFTSISMFLYTALITLIFGLVFKKLDVFLNHPITYVIFPSAALLFCFVSVIGYFKSPQKRIALDLTKYKFNSVLFIATILLIPIIFAINFMFGFSFNSFGYYSLSLLYPSLLTLNYLVYFLTQKIILKTKIVF